MGSGKMGKCYNGKIHLDTEVKNALKQETSFKKQHSNIPSFHYSMWVAHKQNATYKLIISNDYTISET